MFDFYDDIFEESSLGYEVSDAELNKFGIIECAEDEEPETACMRIALENEQNFNAIMNSVMMQEFSVLESTGKEMVWEAGELRRIADRIKEAVQRFWAKVKGIFKKLMDKLATFATSNKAFVRKFRAANINWDSVKSFTGYKFTEMNIKYSDASGKLDSKKNEILDGQSLKTFQNEVRGAIVGSGSISAEDFNKQLKDKLYGNNGNTEVLDKEYMKKNWGTILNQLETVSDDKKAAKNAYKESEDSIREMLKSIKDAEKDTDDGEKKIKNMSTKVNSVITIMSTALSAHTKAISARAQQNRRIAGAVIRSQKKAVGESFTMNDIDDVVLV